MNDSSEFHFFQIEELKTINDEMHGLSQYVPFFVENNKGVCTRPADEKIQELWNQLEESKQQLEQIKQKLKTIDNRPF